MFASPRFKTIDMTGRNLSVGEVDDCGCQEYIRKNARHLPQGKQTFWGIPFDCGDKFVYVNQNQDKDRDKDQDQDKDRDKDAYKLSFSPFTARYIMFLHASETPRATPDEYGIIHNFRGAPQLMEPICEYAIRYSDGAIVTVPMRARMEINDMNSGWGQGSFLSKSHMRGRSYQTTTEEVYAVGKSGQAWGNSQNRVMSEGSDLPLEQWLYAFENPRPDCAVESIEIIKKNGNLFLFGVTAGDVAAHPLRYGRRQKALLTLNGDARRPFDLVDIDLGHIISVTPRALYDNVSWENSSLRDLPARADGQYIVEYNAHEDALFYLGEDRSPLPVKDALNDPNITVSPAERPVTLKIRDKNGNPVPVKVHAHGAAGEYLPPRNRHRLPNPYWFEDYSADYVRGAHWSAYIDGVAQYWLPLGEVFFEVSKGFEIKPVRKRFIIGADTEEIQITLDRVVDWRAKGWVTADTHVHFLSPHTALLEGEAEGVNVINLLASQWGELFTNVGDFTGAGELSNGEHMVRVGTENRQHIMGHISLLGYNGGMILPLTTGGPDESAQGDPMELTLTQWAAQCRSQGGLSIIPHFPFPRAENAAAIVSELIDGVEVTMLGRTGIDPYYLSDWYRYLNCGYHVAAVGGTDKMSAGTAIGEMRTYAKIDGPFTYGTWKEAVVAGRTFTTMGALADIRVEGVGMGGELRLPKVAAGAAAASAASAADAAASLAVEWDVASAVIPVTSVELVKNGETVDVIRLDGMLGEKSGHFTVKIDDSAWLALRVRGRLNDGTEVITAHTSAIFVIVRDKALFNGPDAATILDQIEGATAYVKTLATKAVESQFKLALAALTGAHRALHNKMHAAGHYHNHSPEDAHRDGHGG